ncbi:unnamed protein product [Ciceribacter selenitireducens ATCC BAA-1503]|uniref:Uncharacterized protein n=1 Tax=Ciceribacter selenitireducens ATCC BAA-1503 TaxID=1336235 RepID=A0A376AJ87_9HYPH|nr:unnamed protein product [Ciceribacter selenitireducens ATCC BAA-1503]
MRIQGRLRAARDHRHRMAAFGELAHTWRRLTAKARRT